jgi:hypothetical protein
MMHVRIIIAVNEVRDRLTLFPIFVYFYLRVYLKMPNSLDPFTGDLLSALILVFGFALGFLFYSKYKVQIGGVIATPLLVLYVLCCPVSLVVFFIATVAAFATIELLVDTTLIYGRRLYYFAAIVSIIITFSLLRLFRIPEPAYFSVIPAIVGYNLYRESESVDNLARSIIVWLVQFASTLAVAYMLFWATWGRLP